MGIKGPNFFLELLPGILKKFLNLNFDSSQDKTNSTLGAHILEKLNPDFALWTTFSITWVNYHNWSTNLG